MAVVRCAIIPKGGGQVQNVVMVDLSKDKPFPGTEFIPLNNGERADNRFEYWGEVASGFRFRPSATFAPEYYEGIRVKGENAANAALISKSKLTTVWTESTRGVASPASSR